MNKKHLRWTFTRILMGCMVTNPSNAENNEQNTIFILTEDLGYGE